MLKINAERLWQRHMVLAKIGATAKGGNNRQALTDEDITARKLFITWCEDAGCEIRIDEIGNIFARRSGSRADLPPVMTGSHLATQPTGGRFDGISWFCLSFDFDVVSASNTLSTRPAISLLNIFIASDIIIDYVFLLLVQLQCMVCLK